MAPKTQGLTRYAANSLFLYTCFMITVPIALFFISFSALFSVFGGVPTPESRPVVSGVIAVLGVNLVVAGFIVTAFKEQPEKAGKKD